MRLLRVALAVAKATAYHLFPVAFFLAAWSISAYLLDWPDPSRIPPPHVFLKHLLDPRSFAAGPFSMATPDSPHGWVFMAKFIWNSVWRVLAGMLAGVLLAFPLGLAIALSKWSANILLPVVSFLAPISPIAWIGMAILLISSDNLLAVFIVFVSVVFLLIIATASSIRSVDKSLVDLARSLGATRRQQIFRVLIPASLPAILMILRVNFFAAWMGVLLAEAVGLTQSNWGVGSLIWQARQSMNKELMLAGMILLGLAGLTVDRALLLLQKHVLWWREEVAVAYE